ncbi:MAG TPA: Ig-like domain-containing protein [Gemmatimonadaceae bacterium]|jgi:hypothetical protein
MTVIELVDRERARLRRMHLLAGVALAIGATCLFVALGASALGSARWMTLPRPLPFVVWLLVLAGDALIVMWTMRRLARRTTRHSVAETIEREQSLRAGSLRGAMEVGQSGALGRHAAAAVHDRLAPAGPRLAPAEHRAVSRGVLQAAAAAVIAIAALLIVAPNFNDGLLAILRPVSAWNGTLLPKLGFLDLPPAVLRGESMRVKVAAARRGVITVSQRIPGEAWTSQTVPVDARSGVATVDVGPLRGDVSLVAGDGRSATDTVLVKVTDRPFVGAVSMRATYPAYLGRAAEALAAGEVARVPRGTVIDISGRASTALRAVRLAASDGATDTLALHVNDHAFDGRIAATNTVHYAWIATSAAGPITDLPAPVELEVVPDSAPRVELVSPALDTLVAADDKIAVRATATDDHGIARVELVSWKQGSTGTPTAPTSETLVSGATTVWDGTSVVDLQSHGLLPGDALHVKFIATDNSPWAQRGESRELLLKIPTLEERRAIARASMDSAVSGIQSAAQAEKSLQERTSDAARDRGQRDAAGTPSSADGGENDKSMSFDAAEKTKALAKDQRALTDQVKQLQQTAAGLEKQLAQAGALDSSLARQLQEAQQMLRDALTPELLAQMSKLDTASQQLSRNQAQLSLKELQAMQQKLREQLEKSAEMLKRAALEGSMETLKDEAKDIADRDRALADSAGAAAAQKPGAQKTDAEKAAAKQLADRSQRFEDEVKKLQDRLDNDNANAASSGAEEAGKHANVAEKSMRAAAGNDGVQQNSQQASEQMSSASDAMQQARESQVNQWKSELTNALDKSIQEMLQMARQEQQLQKQAQSGQAKSDDLRGQQSAVKQGLDAAAGRLQQEGQKTSLLSGRSDRAVADAQEKVTDAMKQTTGPQGTQQAAGSLGDAADALNRAAASLARDREKANTASSATGFSEMMQELQEAAKKQGSINAQAQGMLPMPGQGMSAQQQATSRALAREQRQVAQQLDDVGDAVGGDRAADLAKEAKQLADALDGGRIDASTLARQQQLFRRLLDAGKSLQKDDREDTGKREATSAKPGNELAPTNTSATGRAAIKFREPTWDELRGLSADERRAILEYFKRINASTPNP